MEKRGRNAWVHTPAGALSDLARIKEAFEFIRKEDFCKRAGLNLHS